MKILKLLNNKNLSIIFIFLLQSFFAHSQDQPIDIWNIDTKDNKVLSDISSQDKKIEIKKKSIFDLQNSDQKISIKLDQELDSKKIKISGLYDPEEYGLSIDMWSNSDGEKLKKLFKNINRHNLSNDASEIMKISLLTNAYYPNQNITEKEFLNFKSDWLIKNSNYELIEEYLIKNQIVSLHPQLTRFLVDRYLSQSNIKKSCEIFSRIKEPLEDEYLSKFNLYCLINYGKNDEAQLILDLKKEMGFQDEYYENKINYLFGYIEETDKNISEKSILDFHLAHRTNSNFLFEPNEDTPKLIWKYLSSSNLLYKLEDIEITDIEKISIIEKATHDKNFSEEELFEFYKRFQFSINQLINSQESYKSLTPIEGRALLYQRILLSQDPTLKIELIKLLKDLFENEDIGNAFDFKLKDFLNQISLEEIPSNFTSFYLKNTKKKNRY